MHKVCHLTSVHPVFDVRIFYKQCISISEAGYSVTLIASQTKSIVVKGINIIGVKTIHNKFARILFSSFQYFAKALETKSNVYHFHDPELMLCGILLKLSGKKVVFDIHENIRLSIKSKHWISKPLKRIITGVYYLVERLSLLFFDALVLAEDSYSKYYPTKKSIVVLNYPIRCKLEPVVRNFKPPFSFIYTGGVSENRGVWEMISLIEGLLIEGVNCSLRIVGQVYDNVLNNRLLNYINNNNLSSKIEIIGKVDFAELSEYYENSDIGLALLKPIDNYKESLPTKMFEYMQFGLPVIISNFPLYQKYINESKSGISIDVNNIKGELKMIVEGLKDDEELRKMSENGKKAIIEMYNWEMEKTKLVNLYKKIIS